LNHRKFKGIQKMARGGARPGAGRKRGYLNEKNRQIAEEAAKLGITPLEVMLANMRYYWVEGNRELAQSAACDAAPFMHPRLVAANVAVRRPDELSDDELIAAIDIAEHSAGQAGTLENVRGGLPNGTGETRH
jgi:hypothetical protein